jgi:hypothetical protein
VFALAALCGACKHQATVQVIEFHPAARTADDPAVRGDTWGAAAPTADGPTAPDPAGERMAEVKGPPPRELNLGPGETGALSFSAETAGVLRASVAWRGAGPVEVELRSPADAKREDASTDAGGSSVFNAPVASGARVELAFTNRGAALVAIHAAAGVFPNPRSGR